MAAILGKGLEMAMAVVERVLRRVLESDVELSRDQAEAEVRRILSVESPLASPGIVDVVVDTLIGMGPIEPLFRDPTVSDVFVNGPDEVWVERLGILERTDVTFADDSAILAAVERTIAPLGLRLDRASPLLSARLPDGSRLHAVIPPVSVGGPIVAIRRFTAVAPHLETFVDWGSMTDGQRVILENAVINRKNIVVSGGTGTGKTTLLNALAAAVPAGERIVTIEDAAELRFSGHVVRLEARPPNAEGQGKVTLAELVRTALRLRPDRIIVGEVRGAEALDMISAMNTGHDGSLSTVHANGPEDALWRIETLALTGSEGVGETAIRRQLRSAVDLVVHLNRRNSHRQVEVIAEVGPETCQELAC
ncbi:MAG: CpaF family protein [Acidimicrobiia bacterium]|nr:CpaF family protein [Acidimicrobiia bacterium]MYD03337.1 CpaF family protein [Acidimicrobiia bacterium]MYF27022.1 CpaF family protein [Acidimicrobiia bacterium]MYH55600.1 CpaF family protein [Acidimicrobiia bacterium]